MKKNIFQNNCLHTSLRVNRIVLYGLFLLFCLPLNGCQHKDAPEKTDAVDFTIVSGTDIPEDLQKMLDSRQEKTFELSYSDQEWLYIAKGYGKQPTDGYDIVVNDFYKADDELVFDTELFGPKSGEPVSDTPSYPYIVIKTEYRSESIIFQ